MAMKAQDILDQVNLMCEIKRISVNVRKLALEKRTRKTLEETRVRLLKTYETFDENHQKLTQTDPEFSYGDDKAPLEVKEYFDSGLNFIDRQLQEIENTEKNMVSKKLKELLEKDNESIHSDDSASMANYSAELATVGRVFNVEIDGLRAKIQQILAEVNTGKQSNWTSKYNRIQASWEMIQQQRRKVLAEDHQLCFNYEAFYSLDDLVEHSLEVLEQKMAKDSRNELTDNSKVKVKLPKIVLPKFDGRYEEWQAFKNLFVELIENSSLSKIEKMSYLKTNLSGEASKLIQHLQILEENYTSAWQILNNRYDNERLQVATIIDKLLQQPQIVSESATAIKSLHDVTKECVHALQGFKIHASDAILHHLLLKKLDSKTHNLYEQSLRNPRELQDVNSILEFLEIRFQSLEIMGNKAKPFKPTINENPRQQRSSKETNSKRTVLNSTTNEQRLNCVFCQEHEHSLEQCHKFLTLTPEERFRNAKQLRMCINCLKGGHRFWQCRGNKCKKCDKKHHILLHWEQSKTNDDCKENSSIAQEGQLPTTSEGTAAASVHECSSHVFLGTAIVLVKNKHGDLIKCRALLDSGSQLNFITNELWKKLGHSSKMANLELTGIGEAKLSVKHRLNLVIKSAKNEYHTNLEFFIINRITADQPSQDIDTSSMAIPGNISLADPEFNKKGKIDMLIGAELYASLMSIGQITRPNLPTLQNTLFGWVILGRIGTPATVQGTCSIATWEDNVEEQIKRFWEIEEVPEITKPMTTAELDVEEFFTSTTTRATDNKFVVRLPFVYEKDTMGVTKVMAERRFQMLEKKLMARPDIYVEYKKFIDEYIQLEHMEKIDAQSLKGPHSFIPHHCISRPESTTTKLRVVFDASAKSWNNVSLNDLLAKGPTIQDNLVTILMRFRTKKYAFTADIEKMYRQIWIAKEDQNMQLILWRPEPAKEIEVYRLKTVTYGTKTAPYLATKCLQTLAREGKEMFPLAAEILQRDFYMDDCISGADEESQAMRSKDQLMELMKAGGFNLRKWCSNHPALLRDIPEKNRECYFAPETEKEEEMSIKTLGMIWIPQKDEFRFKITKPSFERVTKRIVLAETARLFDPLGLVNPVIVLAKIFMQELWSLKLDWDAVLPLNLHNRWLKFREELEKVANISIPRYVSQFPNTALEIHAFADASEKAFGAVVYIKSVTMNNKVKMRIMCSKSRVAPLKVMTIPRLELCASKLMVDLVNQVQIATGISAENSYYWTDSQIVLNWIKSPSSSYKIFVANRVAAIQSKTKIKNWRYVSTDLNPADLISRGAYPSELASFWFKGPKFLKQGNEKWPEQKVVMCQQPSEEKRMKTILTVTQERNFMDKINHKNSFRCLQRVVAWVLRFVNGRNPALPNELLVKELNDALIIIVKRMQEVYFSEEILILKSGKPITGKSKLTATSPFLDADGILRVGGRLEESYLSYEAKHPIILPHMHSWTKLLLEEYHRDNLHVGPKTLLAIVHQRFWITNAKATVRTVIHNCVTCAKAKPKIIQQVMGNLPKDRVRPSRAFSRVGIDFMGPIQIHYRLRGSRPTKSYICVFVCFSTKAVHFEVAADLSTAAFLSCLERFTGRRGCPEKIYSDNATNFVGTWNKFKELEILLTSEASKNQLTNYCTRKNIEWNFIPPGSPHFGGLWEAAVKSAKTHLKHVLTEATLTQDELNTLIVKIEAILNSRPLSEMSDSPKDLTPLTAGHFLIGAPLTALPDVRLPKEPTVHVRWNMIKDMQQQFWNRWSNEYLANLQLRHKWDKPRPNLKEGTLVMIKDDNLPPLEWRMARIIKAIPGSDGKVRVVELQTSTGVTKRAINRISPLPISRMEENSGTVPQTGTNVALKRTVEPEIEETREAIQYVSKKPKLGLFMTMCVVCCFLPSTNAENFSITALQNSGIYFENVGEVGIVSSFWNFMVYYDLENYWTEYHGFRQVLNKLNQVCEAAVAQDYCHAILNEFRNKLLKIQDTNVLIFNSTSQKRSKRGLMNGIGTFFNYLFGTLDQNYATNMEETINKIKHNEDYVVELSKNQTIVIDATLNIMKKSTEEVHEQFRHIIDEIVKLQRDKKQIEIEGLFSTLAIHTMLMMTTYQEAQATILNVISDTQHGRINTQLVPPSKLKTEINKIKELLPSNLRIPGHREGIKLAQLYNLMSVRISVKQKYVMFLVQLPLILEQSFKQFRVIPLPLKIADDFLEVKTSTDFLLVNSQLEQYYMLTEQEHNKCTRLDEEYILCPQTHPVLNRRSDFNYCEFSLFLNHGDSIPLNCKTTRAKKLLKWTQLHNPNHWLFSTCDPVTITIICQETWKQETVMGVGILELGGNCMLRQDDITIYSHTSLVSSLKPAILPPVNMSIYKSLERENDTPDIMLKQINHTAEINSLSAHLKELRKQIKLPYEQLIEKQHVHNTKLYTIGISSFSLTFIIAVGVIIWMVISKQEARRRRRSSNTVNQIALQLREFKAGEDVESSNLN